MNKLVTQTCFYELKNILNLYCLSLLVLTCSIIGLASPCYAAALDDTSDKNSILSSQLRSGLDRLNAEDFGGAKKIAVDLNKTTIPQAGNILLGGVYYQEKQFQKTIDIVLPVYPIPIDDKTDVETTNIIIFLNMMAASTIGKAQFELKYPDSGVLRYLLEGTRRQSSEGVVDGEALEMIKAIYIRERWFGLALGFGLERYHKLKRLYDSKATVVDRQREEYLHNYEYEFAEMFAAMGYQEESTKWLKKALAYKKVSYRERALKSTLLKPVLESLSLKSN